MYTKSCPLCKTKKKNSKLYFKENFDKKKIVESSFSSRKNPEYMCRNMLKCNNCALVYAEKIIKKNKIEEFYKESSFDSKIEAKLAAETYYNNLFFKNFKIENRCSALDIGCGEGSFLEFLKKAGFKKVLGIEPSIEAIRASKKNIRKYIKFGMFENFNFKKEKFDLISCFMTLEHVCNPRKLLEKMRKLLNPGGKVAIITHNYESFVNRVLMEKSPIVDIEHFQIFNKKSIKYLLQSTNFDSIKIKSFKNTYPLSYWIKLLPISKIIKDKFLIFIKKKNYLNLNISINVGNIISIGSRQ
jgi:2-polyprenyl-3-methyl-5-hydroxy-6-metoxy-1,4-benzoquinol methylase